MCTDRAVLRLDACTSSGCKGPAIDLTCSAKLVATDCSLTGCVGGAAQLSAEAKWARTLHMCMVMTFGGAQGQCGCGTAPLQESLVAACRPTRRTCCLHARMPGAM